MDHFVKLAQVSARNCCSPRKPLMLRSPPPMLVVRPFHCSLRAPVGRGQPAKKPTEKAAPKARDASKKKSSSPTAAGSESAAGETSQERSGQPSISSMADLMANLSPDEQAEIEALSAADRAKFQGAMAALVDPENPEYKQDKEEAVRALDKQTEGMLKEFNDEFRDNNKLVRPRATDFFSMSEEDIEGIEQDPEVKQDDISSLGHGHLDHMREMRHYQRLAAWEMPMLQSEPHALVSESRPHYAAY